MRRKLKNVNLILNGVGACLTGPIGKKKAPLLVLAYCVGMGKDISFIFLPMPAKGGLYSSEDFLKEIGIAEGVEHVTYTDVDGRQKNICFCRPGTGKIIDVVARDYEKDHYIGNFAEIYAANLKFSLDHEQILSPKIGKKTEIAIRVSNGNMYEEDSLNFAVVNAYNACLLSKVFEREELQLETKGKRRVKIEVRTKASAFLENEMLYIKPIFHGNENLIDYYLTEEFHYIDGENVSCRSYKIIYSNRLNEYNLVRV